MVITLTRSSAFLALAPQPQPGQEPPPIWTTLMPIILMVVIFYFILFRPQQKRMKTHQAMLSSVKRGDTVVTNGGIVGRISRVIDDAEVELEIADKTRVRIIRQAIAEVRAKGQPGGRERRVGDHRAGPGLPPDLPLLEESRRVLAGAPAGADPLAQPLVGPAGHKEAPLLEPQRQPRP